MRARASRNSFPLFTHCHLATARGPGDEAHDDGEAAADRTSCPTPDTSGTCALAPAVGASGGRADGTQAMFVRSASSAEHATPSPQPPGILGAHAPNPSASAGLDELACTGSNNMSAKMASRMHAIARTRGVSVTELRNAAHDNFCGPLTSRAIVCREFLGPIRSMSFEPQKTLERLSLIHI